MNRTRAIVTAALLAASGFFGARWATSAHPERVDRSAESTLLAVPPARGAIVTDGELDEHAWQGPLARTGPLRAKDGSPARPHSEARLLWGDGMLYVALYAADRDIVTNDTGRGEPRWMGDSFHFTLTVRDATYVFEVSPSGALTEARVAGASTDYGWKSGAKVGHDVDGTVDDPTDDDEEWAIEMAIPLSSLGARPEQGERLGFSVRRCDVGHDTRRQCASWGETERAAIVLQ